ncbi:hypothetical protein SKAU_G00186680 [Synaphobranchus kaupii]|uniref:Uncharacterized protein n=1 Tax=Synaphobranchus kaupii TaxID=118154 RepID=A0A9Q1FCV9_SYNKA|nr:hypothetical protein SKAU_G00186680 [Synaphobranchus kaupii]
MADEVKPKKDILINALSDFVSVGRSILKKADNECSKGHPQEIASVFGLAAAAASFFTSLSVKKRSEAEELWKTAYHHAEVRDCVEDLLQLEVDWDTFLQRQDVEQQMSDRLMGQRPKAESLTGEMVLTNARTRGVVNLSQYLGKGESLLLANQGLLDAQSVRVLVISFGCQEGAEYWLEDTGCKYDMLLDPQKNMYTAFGLGRSHAKVFKFNNMLEFGEYSFLNRTFPQAPRHFITDIYQMGGDFVLDEGGRVIYSHPSQGPMDRPAAAEILAGAAEGRRPSDA